ncbi:MAG: hypothetical protein ACRDHY_18460, partial [Anaerolineales bacterium]
MPVPTVDRVVRELLRIYGDAEADLRRLLGSPASTEFLRGRSDRLLRQIQALTRELKGRHRRWSARALTQVYRTSSRAILGAGAGFSAIDRTAVQVIAERVVRDLDVAVDGAARNLATVLRRTKQEATGDEALLRQVGRAKALGLTRDDLAKRIARTLRDGATRRLRGAVPPDVAARLWPVAAGQYVPIVDRRGRLRRFGLRHYANLVGHTWAMGASNEAALRAAERFGTDLVQVSVHTNVPDEACRRVQGKVYSLAGRSRDFPPLHFALPLHPNCVPAGTVVTSPQVLVSTARWYEGPLRHLQTRRGHRLAVTPNHPVLTPQGWVPAALLVESGYVLSCTDAEWVTGAIEPDHNHRPALIEQIVETLGGTAPVTAMSMPVAPKDFHGDGIGSEVYVVRAHGLLGNRVDPEIREPALHQLLIGRYAEPPSLTRHGGLTAVLPGLTLPTDGSVCDGSIGTALLRRPRSRQEPVGLHLTTDRHTRHAERSEEFYGRPAEFARKGLGAFAGDVAQDDLGRQGATGHRRDTGFPEPTVEHARADAYLRGELAKRYPGLIGADELIEVRDEDFRGHVYNLQTSLGFY